MSEAVERNVSMNVEPAPTPSRRVTNNIIATTRKPLGQQGLRFM